MPRPLSRHPPTGSICPEPSPATAGPWPAASGPGPRRPGGRPRQPGRRPGADRHPAGRGRAHRHRLAALVYHLAAGSGEPLHLALAGYATRFRRAEAAGEPLAVPRLTDLLDDPAFGPLDDWLREHAADVAEVQMTADFYLEQARRIGIGEGLGEPPDDETQVD